MQAIRCLLVEFVESLRTPLFSEHPRWLLWRPSGDIYGLKKLCVLCIPLRGNSVCILFISSERIVIFFIKFCYSDPSFNRNIWRSIYLKFKQLRMSNCNSSLLRISWHEINLKLSLHWRYILISEVGQWFYQVDITWLFLEMYSGL